MSDNKSCGSHPEETGPALQEAQAEESRKVESPVGEPGEGSVEDDGSPEKEEMSSAAGSHVSDEPDKDTSVQESEDFKLAMSLALAETQQKTETADVDTAPPTPDEEVPPELESSLDRPSIDTAEQVAKDFELAMKLASTEIQKKADDKKAEADTAPPTPDREEPPQTVLVYSGKDSAAQEAEDFELALSLALADLEKNPETRKETQDATAPPTPDETELPTSTSAAVPRKDVVDQEAEDYALALSLSVADQQAANPLEGDSRDYEVALGVAFTDEHPKKLGRNDEPEAVTNADDGAGKAVDRASAASTLTQAKASSDPEPGNDVDFMVDTGGLSSDETEEVILDDSSGAVRQKSAPKDNRSEAAVLQPTANAGKGKQDQTTARLIVKGGERGPSMTKAAPETTVQDVAAQEAEDYKLALSLVTADMQQKTPPMEEVKEEIKEEVKNDYQLALSGAQPVVQERALVPAAPAMRPPETSGLSPNTGLKQHAAPKPHVPAELRQLRVQNGQCPTCGIGLMEKVKRTPFQFLRSSNANTPTPRTLEGFVRNGRCLRCNPLTETELPQPKEAKNTTCFQFQTNERSALGPTTEVIWSTGDRFVGVVRDGMPLEGTLHFSDGSCYAGSWQNSKPHGFGVRRYTFGTVYEGTFVNGRREGSGKCRFDNGDVYQGEWLDGQIHGIGHYEYHRGPLKRFDGQFKHGQRLRGKCTYEDGTVENFRFEDDWPSGEGIRWNAKGTRAWRVKAGEQQNRKARKPLALEDARAMERVIHQS